MLSICSSIENDDKRFELSLRGLWSVPMPFEHVIVLNRCSDLFATSLDEIVATAPLHVTVKIHKDNIHVAKPGLESLLTPPDNEHSPLQYKRRCTALCAGPWVMLTDASFVATPAWISWLVSLNLDSITDPQVMVSMHLRTRHGHVIMVPKLFNFEPAYQRHYWWDLPIRIKATKHITNTPADAFESQWPDAPVHNEEPWFADCDPLLESTMLYAQCLIPSEDDHPSFVEAVSKLFDPDGKFRDSAHDRWVELGSAALRAVRGELGDQWHTHACFEAIDYVSAEQARVYWTKIYAFEFEVSDLQPICEECDAEGGLGVETWPDGLRASGTTLKHVFHALFALDHYLDVEHVVEVGAGYGAFAKAFLMCAQMCNRPVRSYTIAEMPTMQLICDRYLSDYHDVLQFMDPVVCGKDMKQCSLLLSFDGISELASREREAYLKHCVPLAKNVLLRWGCTEVSNELSSLKTLPDWSSSDVRHVLLYS